MVFFSTGPPPISAPKRKLPIPAAVSVNPVTKKGPDWLLGNFYFGTEIGEGQLKKPPFKWND